MKYFLDNNSLFYPIGSLLVFVVLAFLLISLQRNKIELWKIILIVVFSELGIMLIMPVLLADDVSNVVKSVVDVVLLMLFLSPVAWKLKQAVNLLHNKKIESDKSLLSQNILNQLLILPIHQCDIDDFLNKALDIIFRVPGLQEQAKGAIYLYHSDGNKLSMRAAHHMELDSHVIADTGYCNICDSVIAQFPCTHKSSMLIPDIKDHHLITISLVADKQVVGFLCLYFPADQHIDLAEMNILNLMGLTLADLIQSKQILGELVLANTVFKHSLTCLMVADADIRILDINPAVTQLTGYSIEDIKGQRPLPLKTEQHPDCRSAILKALAVSDNWQGEVWDKKKNGETFIEWLSVKVVRDLKGQIQNYIIAFEDITSQKEAEKRIQQLAYYDSLTGLANRALFYDRLEQAILHANRNKTRLALMFIDLDRFKEVNDTLGHEAGDELLRSVAKRISGCLRSSDILARLGGDEFVVVIKDLDGSPDSNVIDSCKKIAENILRKLSEGHQYQRFTFYGGGSMGIVIYPDGAQKVGDLLQRADTAMYEAKSAGRNTYRFFSSELALALENKLSLTNALHNALVKHEFSLLFQPLIALEDNTIIGAEAFLSWNNTEFGVIPTSKFIPLAEENGLIINIGDWVIEHACMQLQKWRQQGIVNLQYLSINISVHQLILPGFVDQLVLLCRQMNIPVGCLELEITEAGLAQYPDVVAEILQRLQRAGFKLAIDDFGLAYSCLHKLKAFNVDVLKIDRSFVGNIVSDTDEAAIVKAVIDLADALGLTALAEGVETREQLDFLKLNGCRYAQGYLFGRPVSAEKFEELFIRSLQDSIAI